MENTTKKIMLSGIQPSGDLHLGNYLGAVKNWSALADEFDCYYFMADLHTLTVRQNPAELRRRTYETTEAGDKLYDNEVARLRRCLRDADAVRGEEEPPC